MTSAPTSYRVTGRTTSPGQAQLAAGDQTVTMDASWAQGPTGLPGPADLLASAFAACLLKNVQRASQLLPFRYQHAEVDVEARRQDSPPRFIEISYELRIATDEPERRVDLLHHNLRQYGTIYNTLAAVCQVHGTVVVSPFDPTAPLR
ncbi:MAG: OsmC family protein [Mycobacteriales bacterium]